MKLIIAGSRSITDKNIVQKVFNRSILKLEDITEVVSGGAIGVDRLGEKWAKSHNGGYVKSKIKKTNRSIRSKRR